MNLESHKNLTEACRDLRDFVNALMQMDAAEAMDALVNHGEDVILRAELTLGLSAFYPGDFVIVEHSEKGDFKGEVVDKWNGTDGKPHFIVKDQDGNAFDVTIGQLSINDRP
jgi:hypothetical protein